MKDAPAAVYHMKDADGINDTDIALHLYPGRSSAAGSRIECAFSLQGIEARYQRCIIYSSY